MKEEKQISLDKQIRQNYRKNFISKTSLVAVFLLFAIASLLLAYFLPITLFITIPFLILPMLTGFIAENMSANTKRSSALRMLFGFRLYYSRQFFGIYRILGAILKTIIVYMIITSILTLILHLSLGMTDSNYMSILDSIIRGRNIEDLNKNIELLLANPTFILIENISEIAAIGLASYMMIHHVLTHSFKVFYNALGKTVLSSLGVNMIHRLSFPKIRKYFYKDYYSSFWYMILVYIVFYVGGALLGLLILNRNGAQSAIIGLFFATTISSFFLPIVFDTLQIIFSVYSLFYIQSMMHSASILKNSFGDKVSFSNEEIALVDNSVSELESVLKEANKPSSKQEENKK